MKKSCHSDDLSPMLTFIEQQQNIPSTALDDAKSRRLSSKLMICQWDDLEKFQPVQLKKS